MSWFSRKKKDEEVSKDSTRANEKDLPVPSAPQGGTVAAYRAIVGPYVTEKAAQGRQGGSYVFRVRDDAVKQEIKRGVEQLYKVHVTGVRVLRVPSKVRHVGRHRGMRSGFKKAIVRLKVGETIDIP